MIRIRSSAASGLAEISGSGLLVPSQRLDLAAGSGITFTTSGTTNTISTNSSFSPTTDGWIDDTSETWTYVSASTFKITGSDVTAKYSSGTRLKFTQTTVKYGTVASSVFAAGDTTVTIIVNTDYVLANAAISANYHSYEENPQGYPGWFDFTSSVSGFSSTTRDNTRFAVVGRTCMLWVDISGTSNAITFSITAPVASARAFVSGHGPGNPYLAGPALLWFNTASTTLDAYKTSAFDTWPGSGTKAIDASITYEF